MLRKVLVSTTLLVLLLGFLVLNGWNLIELNSSVKQHVLAKLRAEFGEACSVEDVSVGLGSVNLEGVTLAFQGEPYALDIDELRIGYSLTSLIKGRGKLERTATEVTLYRPKLTLNYQPQERTGNVELSLDLSPDSEARYRALLKQYHFINRITISEGEVELANLQTDQLVRLATMINGYAYTDDRERAWLRLAGHIFDSDTYNLVMYGQLDLKRGGLDYLNVDLHDYKVGQEVPLLVPEYFDILDGVVNGHFEITERRAPTRGFDIAGSLTWQDGRLRMRSQNLYVEDIQLEAQVRDWNLEIQRSSQNINGSPVRLAGRLRNLLDPIFDVHLRAEEFNVGRFFDAFLPGHRFPVAGRARLALTLSESMAEPVVSGTLVSDSLVFLDQRFDSTFARLRFEDRVLTVSEVSGRLGHAALSGGGRIDFGAPDPVLDFGFGLDGEVGPYLERVGLAGGPGYHGRVDLRVFGDLANPVSRGEFGFTRQASTGPGFQIQGSLNYHDNGVLIQAASEDGAFKLNAKVSQLSSRPYWDMDVTGFEQLLAFVDRPVFNDIRKHYNLTFRAEGFADNPRFLLDAHRKENFAHLFEVVTDTSVATSETLAGRIVLFPDSEREVGGEFEVQFHGDEVRLNQLYLGDWLRGNLVFSRSRGLPVGGEIDVSGLDLSLLFAFLQQQEVENAGQVYGRLEVTDEAAASGDFWLVAGFFRGVGPISGEFKFNLNDSQLQVLKLSLANAESAKMLAQGYVDLASGETRGTVAGSDVAVDRLLRVLTGSRGNVAGSASFEVTLDGRGPRIPIYGAVRLRDARILRLGFDEVLWDLGQLDQPNGSYVSSDGLYIGRTVLKKNDEFTLEGRAWLPLRGDQDLDVRLAGEGNFLSLLTDIEPLFYDTESTGRLNLQLSGRYTRPRFTGSRFRFADGRLRLTAVSNEVNQIEGDFEVEANEYFLRIHKLTGLVRGQRLSISNPDTLEAVGGRVLQPIRIGGDDLSLGVLQIVTSSDGLPINIPGLMEAGEMGWYAVTGKSANEPFFIAGPWHRPYVRGEIQIRHANLTFPFEDGPANEHSVAMRILNNLEWDVRVLSKTDTRYVKQFGTGVYVNMEVDHANSALDLTGTLRDSTFRIEGQVLSKRGEFEYLDQSFRVERFGAEFDRSSLFPVVYGKAWTVVRDTSNVPYDVYLELYTVDDLTNQEVTRGRWNRLALRLYSEYPGYEETQADVMAVLGYTAENVQEQATKAFAYRTDRLLFRPIMRPIERGLERALGLDVVRFSYAITKNFLDANFNDEQLRSTLELLRSSRLLLGKYLTDNVYLLYTGELKTGLEFRFQDKGVGLQHRFGLEYRLNSQWLLQMEYDYNTLLETHKDDKKIWLRHSFVF